MRSKVTFYSNVPTANDTGGRADNWVEMVVTRGRLRNNSGRKMDEQGEIVFTDEYELICRYQDELLVDAKAKLVIDGESYRIKYKKLIDQIRHIYVFILAKNER